MKANIEKGTSESNTIIKNRKESKYTRSLIGQAIGTDRDGKPCIDSPVDARFYQTEQRIYCCVWISGKDNYFSGGAWAGGYGYHKSSQALENALRNAGVFLDQPIGGYGDSAMDDAIKAIMVALGYSLEGSHILRAHG